jgi:pilus assembly protein FimV
VFEIDPYNIDVREKMKDLLLEAGRIPEALSQLFFLVDVFRETQPEGAVYYLHEILKMDPPNAKARTIIKELGGIMPEEIEEKSAASDWTEKEEPSKAKLIREEEVVVVAGKPREIAAKAPAPSRKATEKAPLPSIPAVLFGSASSASAEAEVDPFSDEEFDGEEHPEPLLNVDENYSMTNEESTSSSAGFDTSFSNLRNSEVPEFDPSKPLIDETSTSMTLKELSTQIEESVINQEQNFEEVRFEELSDRFPATEEAAEDDVPDIQDDLDEIAFFLEQELVEEASQAIDELKEKYPDDPRVIQTARAIAQLLAAGEAPEEEQTEEEEAADGVVSRYQSDEQQEILEDDFSTHYDLGIAYKDMGLFDDAIQEFKIAAGDTSRTAMSKMMIGMCYNCLERNEDAVEVFKEGLMCKPLETQHELGLLYELGVTFQMMGKRQNALACFKKISKIEPDFTDVPARIKALTRTVGPTRK